MISSGCTSSSSWALQLFLDTYNHARRLKTLQGLMPYEFICKTWTVQPTRSRVDLTHLNPGANN